MKRIWLLFLFTFVTFFSLHATHQRAAEILYEHIDGFTFKVTIIMYTYTPSPADDVRTSLPIKWGDNSTSQIPRITFQALPDNYTLNVYEMNHTFPAAGSYLISVEDPNRNFGVVNIPNSVNVPIYVESLLVINPFLGVNNSVQLLNPPIDQGCVGKLFVHNASAYDPDGDSLSYRLVSCRGTNGQEIPGYSYPMASESFSIDSITGDVKWENPVLQGEYNIAFVVDEWRNGVKVGSVMRDMQILIGACNNNPPIITAPVEACAIAGKEPLVFDVVATDPDNNAVLLTASGGPFEFNSNPAAIVPDPGAGTPTASTTFYWSASCEQVRRNTYSVLFKARDVHPEVSLTSLHTTSITVAAPPVEALSAEALGIGINLEWDTYDCPSAAGFYVYRSAGTTGFIPDDCQTGIPSGIGFQRIAVLNDIQLQSFRDDNNAQGLVPGINYCYVVSAFFEDGAESMVSNEACAALKRDLPIMTHVSNDSLNLNSGSVIVAWSKPTELDTIQYPGPYQYDLYRMLPEESAAELVHTAIGINDTLFKDITINLNELNEEVQYQVLLKSLSVGDVGFSKGATSVFLEISPTDEALQLSWSPVVPWQNDSSEIYRFDEAMNDFVRVGVAFDNNFLDKGLQNEVSYLYYIRTFGRLGEGFVHPIVNYSQLIAATPIDNVPPCPPEIVIETDCSLVRNKVVLDQIFDSCSYDVRHYRVYYAPTASAEFLLIDSIPAGQTFFLHQTIDFVTGCYYVTAVDSTGNVSQLSNVVCVDYDVCPVLDLPNVFTPNADQFNDLFVPIGYPEINPNANIERVEMVIFNRWGNLVFETSNPAIEWDGKNQRTGTDCAEGTYFYVCEVYFQSLEGLVKQRLQGSVTIVR